ncbi:unnamed protein product [Cuscuta epithymum]|uniref:Protein kinase domain-containing protein n=1 Tax=Cuscuta epithymum TaxID=186058 RepID=A0AAV0D727_9ASTE|nr:unnamed protein product [Cuscuta epithymum]
MFILLAVFLNLFHRSEGETCAPSSCGHIGDIHYPLRLSTDPEHCGDGNHTLFCENNNATVLYLYSWKFNVRSINYTASTIRVSDVGVREGDCSSFPISSLSEVLVEKYDPYDLGILTETMVLVSCPVPLNSSHMFDTSPFLTRGKYSYLASYFRTLSDLKDQCSIENSVMVPFGSDYKSYEEVHQGFVSGFDISWDTSPYSGAPPSVYMCELHGWFALGDDDDSCRKVDHRNVGGIIIEIWKTLKGSYLDIIYMIGLLLATKAAIGAPFMIALLIYTWGRRHLSAYDKVEDFLKNHNNLMPIRYSYAEIKKMTGGFKETLGKGGFGAVYKGKLRSGHFAAVKMLLNSKGNGEDFISEVATIERIHHVNVVQLIGFCVEGCKRALVYEFMPNGSLDKYLLSQEGLTSTMTWEEMFRISVGVARGIQYLHQGCDMQILHFDIKPHNILLDENFTPKVSDFGLAKLYSKANNSIATMTAARGTIGYMAPELFYKNIGRVSHKADVYGFGMLLLDMAGKRNKLNISTEDSSQYFPQWVYNQVSDGRNAEIGGTTEEDNKIAKKMVIVGLWCIEMNPCNRPSMNKVVDMLNDDLDSLQLPPRAVPEPIDVFVNDDTNTSFDYATDSSSLISKFKQQVSGST